MELIFFAALFFSLYSYIIFPVFINFLGKFFPNHGKRDCWPIVTIIISAYNEEKDIEKKIRNSLLLDYPEDKLEIVVSSDGSSDRTNEIAAGIKDKRLMLKAFPDRLGKTACLNKVIPNIKGEIVVFTDANSMFAPDMLQHLVTNFMIQPSGLSADGQSIAIPILEKRPLASMRNSRRKRNWMRA